MFFYETECDIWLSIFAANATRILFQSKMSGDKIIIIDRQNLGTTIIVTIGGKPFPVTESSDEVRITQTTCNGEYTITMFDEWKTRV